MDHFGQFWPEEIHFGPFRSANRTLAIPDYNRKEQSQPITTAQITHRGGCPFCSWFKGVFPWR